MDRDDQRHINPAGRSPDVLQYIGRNFYALGWSVLLRRNTSREPPDETLLQRRPLYVFAALLAIFSLILRQPLLFIAGLVIFMLALLPEIWYRYCLRELSVECQPASGRAVFGDRVDVTLVFENRKVLPLPWLEVESEFPDALPLDGLRLRPSAKSECAVLPNTVALWAYQRVKRRYTLRAVARGAYRFGPMTVRASDPFGILTREAVRETAATLLVHPIVAPLERFGLQPHAPFGPTKVPRRLLEDPLRIVGTRPYAPGDEPRRIHWKASARTGALQSKVYEPSARHTLTIFLDVRTLSRQTMGFDPDLVELSACAAASVANWALEHGYAVGVYSNGTILPAETDSRSAVVHDADTLTQAAKMDEERLARAIARSAAALRLRVPPAPRAEQLLRVLDGLARLVPYYGLPMDSLLSAEQQRLPFGATIVYIGAESAVDVPLLLALRQARAHGHAVSLLLTTGEEAGEAREERSLYISGLPTHYIGGRATWHELVADALGHGNVRQATSKLDDPAPSGAMPPTFGNDTPRGGTDGQAQTEENDGGSTTASAGASSGSRHIARALVVE
jgi:uncharacterized protein (DUF58 family)